MTDRNRQIDALVATHVMGWKPPARKITSAGDRGWWQQDHGRPWVLKRWYGEWDPSTGDYPSELLDSCTDDEFKARYYWQSPDGIYAEGSFKHPPVHYSTDPAASKALRDRMRELGWYWRVEQTPSGKCTAAFWCNGNVFTARADTEELAVALAALKAFGVEVPE